MKSGSSIQTLACVLCVTSVSLSGSTAKAQDAGYPNKLIRVIVPAAPGGGADIIARLFAQPLGKSLGQSVVVENRPGASNIIGTELVAKAPGDGYTLLLGTTGALANNPLLYVKLPYDSIKDFAPVSNVANSAFVLVVHPAMPVKTVPDLVTLAKRKPGELSYASWGKGSSTHLATMLLSTKAQINMIHVPYKGSGHAMPDMIAGNVQMAFDSLLSSVPYVKAGRLRALGISALKVSAVLPDVPTIASAGYDGFEAGSWYGFLAPAKTAPQVVTKLHGELMKAIKQPEVLDRMGSLGTDPIGNTPAEFSEQIRDDLAKWAKVVKAAGIQQE